MDITFVQRGRRTRMTLVQHGYPTAEMRDDVLSGWSEILSDLVGIVPLGAGANERLHLRPEGLPAGTRLRSPMTFVALGGPNP